MDMWHGYSDAVHRALPDAVMVVDKFQVLRLVHRDGYA
ncbi:MAG: hypothetical protein C7B46_17610 [Sulfobacillus benefaciens]|uniref:Transposase IS204/IS1001/IS1096/IS1165 DDE domain-containing protein n=1 Tax=Sulfobacillus benefaciens TaxID=453960 RepID=A0A2T2X8B0_9FIRM|nr:MAG: hypothetical protein C7B46_17610 [Sulfobacillus benefaciens]